MNSSFLEKILITVCVVALIGAGGWLAKPIVLKNFGSMTSFSFGTVFQKRALFGNTSLPVTNVTAPPDAFNGLPEWKSLRSWGKSHIEFSQLMGKRMVEVSSRKKETLCGGRQDCRVYRSVLSYACHSTQVDIVTDSNSNNIDYIGYTAFNIYKCGSIPPGTLRIGGVNRVQDMIPETVVPEVILRPAKSPPYGIQTTAYWSQGTVRLKMTGLCRQVAKQNNVPVYEAFRNCLMIGYSVFDCKTSKDKCLSYEEMKNSPEQTTHIY